jgi:hypothetical protein
MRNVCKLNLNTLLFFVMCGFSFTMQGQVTFEKMYPTNVVQEGRDVLPTPDGGYLLVGMTQPSPADTDLYVMKTDSLGNMLWSASFGGTNQEYPYQMVESGDGNYLIVGYTSSYGAGKYDTWLLKMGPAGNIIWTKTYGGADDDVGHSIIATTDGNFVIAGRSSSFHPANSEAYLMKVDPLGNTLWTQYYGGPQYETAHSVQQCLDGGYIFCGQTYSYGQGAGDIYMVKTDSYGNAVWSQTFGGTGIDDGNWILQNTDGTYIICAETSSTGQQKDYDVQVIKTDAGGNSIWSKLYGGSDKDISHMMQLTSDGGYVIAAISRSFGWVNPDMWIVKIDVAGNTSWTQHYGGYDHEHCYAVKQTTDGGYIALGHTLSYGPTEQIMFLKLDGSGAVSVEEPLAASNLFSVYPNPTEGKLNVNVNSANATSFKIRNELGEIVYSEEVGANVGSKSIDLKDNGPGVYFVSLNSKQYNSTKKVVVK